MIAAQQKEIVHLRGDVECLLPLALPAPSRGIFACSVDQGQQLPSKII